MTINPTLIDLDALIIGGGVQGLWLLNDLRKAGYSVVLLERGELGGVQTCHSHVYIHQGCLYTNAQLASGLKKVQIPWEQFMAQHKPLHGVEPSIFGFTTSAATERRTRLWKSLGIYPVKPQRAVDVARCLCNGQIEWAVKSPEQCLDGQSLVECLSAGGAGSIGRLREVERFHWRMDPGTVQRPGSFIIEEVNVTMGDGRRVGFRPKAVVLAAGAGNAGLLDLLSAGHRRVSGVVQPAQQIRKAHMLVVKGVKDHLDPLTGVFLLPDREFPLFSFFIVSRRVGEETVWLISDNRSGAVSFVEDWLEFGTQWWLPLVLRSLQKLAPTYFGDPNRQGEIRHSDPRCQFQWGIYEAPKAEGRAGGNIPHEECIERYGFRNLWAVWPTKLTLAPRVSEIVREEIQKLIPKPTSTTAPLPWLQCPTLAPERWKKTPLMSWEEFCRCYL